MHLLRCRPLVFTAAWFAAAAVGQAHPGHDGHDLTWDLGHLAAFPFATVICFAAVGLAGWIGFRALRRAASLRVQSLRASQPIRGK